MATGTLQSFNVFLTERLTATAADIYGFVEKTVVEYQKEVYRSKLENRRLQRLLNLVYKPEIRLNRANAREIEFPMLTKEVSAQEQQKEYVPRVAPEEPDSLPLKEERGGPLTGCVEPPVCPKYSVIDGPTRVVIFEGHSEHESSSVSQDTVVSETEASSKPAYDNNRKVVKQSAPSSAFQELQAHWSNKDEGKLQILLQGDVVASCSKYEQSPQSSQNQTVASRDLPAVSSAEEIKSEDEDYKDAEADILWQHDSLDCGDENDTSDVEFPTQGVTMAKSNENSTQSPNRPESLTNNMDLHYPPNYVAPAQIEGTDSLEPRGANVCYVCGKTFTMKGSLKRHMFGHTGLKPHGCKECGRTFARIESLRVHMRTHTLEIPYTCDFCGKAFRHRGNMICHIRTHTGEKPYRCSICAKAYGYVQDLRKHMQIHAKVS